MNVNIKRLVIKDAKQALKESKALKSIWSEETLLTQRVLIYIAELLEQIAKKKKKKRKPNEWNLYAAKAMHEGKTMKQAAKEYKERNQ